MGESTTVIKQRILKMFPGLVTDADFKVTSFYDTDYNCIAWAYQIGKRWMWPPAGQPAPTPGAYTFWPNDNQNDDVSEFIKAFQGKSYEVCESSDKEEGFQKIALYVRAGTTHCTHAARQLSSGYWTSKLGRGQDIQHGTPYTIEGSIYGKVHCIMKRKFP